MDRVRAIALIESEIRRREALAKMGGFFAKDHLEVAAALREMLEAYKEPAPVQIPVFREHNVRAVKVKREWSVRRK